MTPAAGHALLLWTAGAVLALIALIGWARLNAFVALTLVSLFIGAVSGMPLSDVVRAFQDGVGNTLGFIAVVIGLGTIVGKMLAESGGAEVIARRLASRVGPRGLPWIVALVAFVVGLPIFFSVGLVLLAPIVFTLARRERIPLLVVGLPLVAGLSASHGLVPPHPGPLAAIERLHADMGRTILWSLAIALPAALIVGPPLGLALGRRIDAAPGALAAELTRVDGAHARPSLGVTLLAILLPIVLMVAAAAAGLTWPSGSTARTVAEFLGHPIVAMGAAVLMSFYVFGVAQGRSRQDLLKFSEECLGPVASVLLVVGAGGGFGRVLDAAGVGSAIHQAASGLRLSPLLLGWIIAALLRISVGSATVAIVTSAGIIAPLAAAVPGTSRELLVIALGAGSIAASHVNDGGFWLVKEYFNLSVVQTLATWTVLETAFSIVALCLVLLASLVA